MTVGVEKVNKRKKIFNRLHRKMPLINELILNRPSIGYNVALLKSKFFIFTLLGSLVIRIEQYSYKVRKQRDNMTTKVTLTHTM